MIYAQAGIGFLISLFGALLATPLVRRLSLFIGAVDEPDERKVHHEPMPRLGGLAIFLGFLGGFAAIIPSLSKIHTNTAWALLLGGSAVIFTGFFDDRFGLRPRYKLLGVFIAALILVFFDLRVSFITIPFSDSIQVQEWMSIAITLFWIVGVTNAVNLIDGLDGLAAGVSSIAILTIMILSFMMGNTTVFLLGAIVLGSALGFLYFNFYPARIFMGDTGALFLGFCIATLSILGFKKATLVSFIVPLLIIGVPFVDTAFAIIRRKINRQPISVADKGHLHHCLLRMGFSHRTTVLIIYGVSLLFSALALILSQAALWVTAIVAVLLLLAITLLGDRIGIIHTKKRPVLHFVRSLFQSNS